MAPDLWTLTLEGGGGKAKLSGDLDREIGDLTWAPGGDQVVSLSTMADDGTAVGERSTPKRREDLVRYRLPGFDGFERITEVNADVLADVELGDVEEIWYRSTDDVRVQGWIVKPPSFDREQEYPMMLFIHGGPHAMYDVGFSWLFQNLAANTDIPYFTYNFFEEPFWEDPDPWLEHSPLMYADQVTTPTLLATGGKDLRTPMPQTEEFYQALKRLGVTTVLLRFNEEYHGIWSKPSNFMRAQRYIIEWFENDGRIEGLTVEEDGGPGGESGR